MASSDTFKHLPRSEKLGSWLKLLITVVAACDASEKNDFSERKYDSQDHSFLTFSFNIFQ